MTSIAVRRAGELLVRMQAAWPGRFAVDDVAVEEWMRRIEATPPEVARTVVGMLIAHHDEFPPSHASWLSTVRQVLRRRELDARDTERRALPAPDVGGLERVAELIEGARRKLDERPRSRRKETPPAVGAHHAALVAAAREMRAEGWRATKEDLDATGE